MKMYISVRMDRPITPQHYITPGGFNFTVNGKAIEFDFFESTGGKTFPMEDSGDRSRLYSAELRFLDIKSFPESTALCEEGALNHIEKINELFVYTGEPGEDPIINVEKITDVVFEEAGKIYSVSPEVLETYNDEIHCQNCKQKRILNLS